MAAELVGRCRRCDAMVRLSPASVPEEVPCPACASPLAVAWPSDAGRSGIEACVLCGFRRFFSQRDFNRGAGLWLVVAAILASAVLFAKGPPLAWLSVLGAFAVVDGLLLRLLPEVVVCYVCQSVYRGFPRRADQEAYDPKVAASVQPLRGTLIGAPPSAAAGEG
ncbi:MAG: hypothetical protein HY608_02815 [Planctomycetes bacterium]|nr:hypothetical protein [Planctomycetota bacterium]